MFERKNLLEELLKARERMLKEEALMEQVRNILQTDEEQRQSIRDRLEAENAGSFNNFSVGLLEPGRIFHISQICKICIDYRLRFLDSHLFKNTIPEEAISNINKLEKEHETTLKSFKIMAPSKQFYLNNYDDPLLFAPIGDDYYYLIHKWGTDLHPLRKLIVRPMRDFGSLLVFLLLATIALTWAMTEWLFYGSNVSQFVLVASLFTFKSLCGVALYYCFWKGKNFNSAIWNSPYYNK